MFEDAGRLAQLIDHTLVRPDATLEDLAAACADAKRHHFAALVVSPWLAGLGRAKAALEGSGVKLCVVVGFPHGTTTTTVKIFEAMEALKNGAEELDIMLNPGMVRSGRFDLCEIDIKNVITMSKGVLHKVIVESGSLAQAELAEVCRIAVRAGAEFIKTSTGYGPRGATADDVRAIRAVVGSACRIKASGGIRGLATVKALVDAGAERIGTSSGPAIMEEYLREARS